MIYIKLIRARAPLRISFGGGGTDVSPYCDEHGGLCFNSTIDRYSYCTIIPTDSNLINIHSVDFDLKVQYPVGDYKSSQLDLVTACLKKFDIREGCDIIIHCDAPPGSGLGTSSTVMVSVIKALSLWQDIHLNKYDIAKMAYILEREKLGISGGYQDQLCASFGGFNRMLFNGRKGTNYIDWYVSELQLSGDIINELQYNLLLCYTGNIHSSSVIMQDQLVNHDKPLVQSAMDNLKRIAHRMIRSVSNRELDEFGRLLNESWQYKKLLSDKITTPHIDELYETALSAGALGGKLLGAGGGGYLLLYCPFDKRPILSKLLTDHGGQISNFGFEDKGAQAWIVNK